MHRRHLGEAAASKSRQELTKRTSSWSIPLGSTSLARPSQKRTSTRAGLPTLVLTLGHALGRLTLSPGSDSSSRTPAAAPSPRGSQTRAPPSSRSASPSTQALSCSSSGAPGRKRTLSVWTDAQSAQVGSSTGEAGAPGDDGERCSAWVSARYDPLASARRSSAEPSRGVGLALELEEDGDGVDAALLRSPLGLPPLSDDVHCRSRSRSRTCESEASEP